MTGFNCIVENDKIKWSVAAELPSPDGVHAHPGLAGPIAGIINNRLLISGGANFPERLPWRGGKKVYHDEIYLFEKFKGQIIPTLSKQKLPQPVAYCANVKTLTGLVYLGGENEQGVLDKVVLIKNDDTSGQLSFTDLPPLPLALSNLSAASIGTLIYAGGGITKEGSSNKFFFLDMAVPGANWQALPDIPIQVAYAVMVAQSNGGHKGIYLIGGRRKNSNGLSDIFSSVYQFDIKTNQWQAKRSLPYSISAGTGIASNDDQLFLFGGDKGETFTREEKLSALIRTEKDEQKNGQLVKEKIALLDGHPGFTRDVLIYNTLTDTWKNADPLPFASPVTTTAINWEEAIIIPSGEIKAGVRTPKIIMGKLEHSHKN